VASADQHHRARLLNAVTSPHVTLRSAARASSCLPGFSKPVVLEAKDGRGNIRPYLPSQGWIDGAISSDLPMRPLARLYQVNHFIVSQINPVSVIAPYLVSDRKSDQSGTLASASKVYFSAMREAANRANQMVWPIRNRMTEGVAARFDRMELQNYSGDVTISHKFTSQSLRYLRFDFRDDAEIEHLAMAARRATWTRIDQIRNAMAIAQRLERVKQHLAPV
jgi:NTE family protein